MSDGIWKTLILDHLPVWLLDPGPLGLLWWQWLAIPVFFLLSWGAGLALGRLLRGILSRIAARTATDWDDALLDRVSGPLTLACALAAGFALLPLLELRQSAEQLGRDALKAVLLFAFFWALARSVDVAAQIVGRSRWAEEHPGSRSLVPLGSRTVKVLVFAMAVVALLSELGYPVASLVAGLGIGGLAFALAAQKTVENLFGAFSIGADQPFREGDFVRIEEFVGTVEAIGLRSTKIRTLDRTIISIPNGRLADMRLETFAVRDRLRLACTLGLVYETTAEQMRQVLAGLERVLREHPKIWTEVVNVRFAKFADFSLDIEIMAWFQTSDWAEFLLIRQDMLLQFMDVVEKAGSSFAFPTRTLHLLNDTPNADKAASAPRAPQPA
jgi:MscS family membrane protein